ncbi:MAG: penicillin-binding protein 2 [Gammaproteobacteria bacterium]|nr:penicillin-binding protein 2 [Gammaproteobacteria bacterium]
MSVTRTSIKNGAWLRRRSQLLMGFILLALWLVLRAFYLQVLEHDFYQSQGHARQLRTTPIVATRGMLLDRHGEPLAVSTPIQSVWAVPDEIVEHPEEFQKLSELLDLDFAQAYKTAQRMTDQGREFMYVKRHIPPALANQVMELEVAGVSLQREFRRYYPSGKAAAHVIGFTDIDDVGREGLEMAYDGWLQGSPGLRKVVRDLNGHEIADIAIDKPAVPGKDLRLSIDKQLQYFADRALGDAVAKHRAESANLVVMNVRTGEILAMTNYPTYNPNDISDRSGGKQRNRSITDVFEPGSTLKPFTIAAALESGKFQPEDIVYTSPGHYDIGEYRISDARDHGWLDLAGIVKKSSNVGVSKVARQLEPDQMWSVFDAFGFGRPTGSEFPGEVAGYFNHPTLWHYVEQASVSYGYGISVSALQLVRAYSAIANKGVMPPVSFVAADEPEQGKRVINESIALELARMLEGAVADGTGTRASIRGYRVAGKTGTSHQSQGGGYAEDRYLSLFAGFAPVSNPELAAVVVIHTPQAGEHFGSVVAAPVFAEVMAHALRLQGVEPDDIGELRVDLGSAAGDRS